MPAQSKLACPTPNPQAPQLPRWVEAVVVGGLILVVYSGPAVASAVLNHMRTVRPGVKNAYQSAKSGLLNRLQKRGSCVRVVASLLPEQLFTPPSRCYMVGLGMGGDMTVHHTENLRADVLHGTEHSVVGVGVRDETRQSSGTNEDEIVAFQLETESSLGDGDDEDETESNTDEGWDQPDSRFRPFCSTPQLPDHLRNRLLDISRDSASTVGEGDADLRRIVMDLYSEVTTLREAMQSRSTTTTAFHQTRMGQESQSTICEVTIPPPNFPPPPPLPPMPSLTIPVVPSAVGGCAPPPPPPPPPMPNLNLVGSQPLIIQKRNQAVAKAPMSMSEILKDLPGAKNNLRKIARSPGGTPIKQKKKMSGIRGCMLEVLRMRNERMCPSDDEDDNGSFKENDEFNDTPDMHTQTVPKRNNCYSSPRNTVVQIAKKPPPSAVENNVPLFGQHLLKKSKTNLDSISTSRSEPASDGIQVLRPRNQ